MADKKISQETEITNGNVDGTENVVVAKGGNNFRALVSSIATWIRTQVTKSDVGLSNVDNTSDANKPVSTATQAALDLKANITALGAAAFSNRAKDLTTIAEEADMSNPAIFSGGTLDLNSLPLADVYKIVSSAGTETITAISISVVAMRRFRIIVQTGVSIDPDGTTVKHKGDITFVSADDNDWIEYDIDADSIIREYNQANFI